MSGLKIVQVGKYYEPVRGGIENNTKQMAELAAREHDSTVVCMQRGASPSCQEVVNGINVFRLRSWGRIWRQEVVKSPRSLLQGLAPDIIHFHGPNPLLTVQLCHALKALPASKVVITHHADLHRPRPIRDLYQYYYGKLLDRAEKVIVYTRTMANSSRELRATKDKQVYIPHGIDLPIAETLSFNRASRPIRTVGFIGRIERWKGVDTLLHSLAHLPSMRGIVAGDGGYLSMLNTNATKLGLKRRVQFFGEVQGETKHQFFEAIDMLVLPSLTSAESYGQVLVEAQLCGVPVIASDLGTGINEICDHGNAGLLVPAGDPAALKLAIEKLSDPAINKSFSERGRRHAKQNFSIDAVSKKVVSFYSDLATSRLKRSA